MVYKFSKPYKTNMKPNEYISKNVAYAFKTRF